MSALRRFRQNERDELFEHVEAWTTFVLANILWSIVSIPLITMPAATAGLFSVLSKRARGQPVDLFHEFFGTMRRLWLKATLIMLLNLLLGGLLTLNLSIFPRMEMSDPLAFLARSVTLFGGLMLVLTNFYVWSLMVLVDLPLKQLIEAALKLVFMYPIGSLGLLAATAIPIVFSLLLPQGIFLLATVAGCVLIICLGTWRVIRRHLSESERAALEAPHSP